MYELTAIYWVKNETYYLPEWIEFHILQGFDHFILYDNQSTDGIHEIMKPYVDEGLLEIREYPNPLNPPARSGPAGSKNFWVMDFCVEEQRGKSKWIHFHAVDEFTFLKEGGSIPEFLKEYEDFGALSIEWEFFNGHGHVERPKGLVIENYTEAFADEHHHVKTIIRPDFASRTLGTPHNFEMLGGKQSVNERKTPVHGFFNSSDPGFDKIKNHHYVSRSQQEFMEKNNKGLLDFSNAENVPRPVSLDAWHADNNRAGKYECQDLIKYVEPVKKAISERYKNFPDLIEKIAF